ncbi:MAG: DUF3192 domain-containing protein [Paraglaciecola sp.]|uniref:DUF3192 domain-containing protein n=1 Tax=Paraglaciecola sp. TaxID=1920173 RepID=UPI00273F5EE6|nr:DUF3192 domain-containing protein [Paraglaciecola sp.]MDP5031453.1 DUF3192 domain-containing protein [Paraglaciecola sp.]MDP5130798.1 DUF3192 domain-containing protein [Paraglaciecola sp.]
MRKLVFAAMLGTSLALSGCVISVDGDSDHAYQSDWQDKEQKNRRGINALSPLLSFKEVTSRMGTPDFNEYYENKGNTYQVLYFRTQRLEGDGVTTKDECTPLIFKNGELAGWGDTAYKLIAASVN